MLPKRHKLSRALFPRQKEQELSWGGKVLRICAYKGDTDSPPRFAVVVSKNKSTGAVSRNAFRRRVMAAVRENLARFVRLSSRRYVIFPREHLRTIAREDIKKDITAFLDR